MISIETALVGVREEMGPRLQKNLRDRRVGQPVGSCGTSMRNFAMIVSLGLFSSIKRRHGSCLRDGLLDHVIEEIARPLLCPSHARLYHGVKRLHPLIHGTTKTEPVVTKHV